MRHRRGAAALVPEIRGTRARRERERPSSCSARPSTPFHTASWVRRHDAVIVPGMGALEASLPLRPWQTPYAMFLLCASGKLVGTKVAMVSVGANEISPRADPLAVQCSGPHRVLPVLSRHRVRGTRCASGASTPSGTTSIPTSCSPSRRPSYAPGDPQTVGIGVMAYYGTNDDRHQRGGDPRPLRREDEAFHPVADRQRPEDPAVRGRHVRRRVVQEIVSDLRAVPARSRPGIASSRSRWPHSRTSRGRWRPSAPSSPSATTT